MFFTVLLLTLHSTSSAQYILNGSATQNSCNCYTLTPAQFNQGGSVWNSNKISLSASFEYSFNVFLGEFDGDGADGLAFVLQPVSTSLGSSGGGLGFENISPSVAVSIDTWQNVNNADPVFDHIAIQANGDLNHNSINNLAGPVQALENIDDIEDSLWHVFKVKWDATTKTLSASVDGVLRVSVQKDLVADIFGNDNQVFWGFTAATGGARNLQQFCTSLTPSFTLAASQATCVGQPISFLDASTSFGTVTNWFWNFGDGNASFQQNPTHTYAAAGVYNVFLVIRANDGCTSDTLRQQVTVGSFPTAQFTAPDVCEGTAASFTDNSFTAVGNINSWQWDFGDGTQSTQQSPTHLYTSPGPKTVTLRVRSAQGCQSTLAQRTVNILPIPDISAAFRDTCVSSTVLFSGVNNRPAVPIQNWEWWLGDGTSNTNQQFNHNFTQGGTYSVRLLAKAVYGCPLDTIRGTINIGSLPLPGFTAPDVCEGLNTRFTDTSKIQFGTINSWQWNFGDGNSSTQQNPAHLYGNFGSFNASLTVTTNFGCRATLPQLVTVIPKAKVDMAFADDCTGRPVNFNGLNLTPNLSIQNWDWRISDGFASGGQQFQHSFVNGGSYTIRLVATPVGGCASDPVIKTIQIFSTIANAGKDTVVAIGQPFPLRGSGGGSIFNWSPATGLNDPNIANPTGILQQSQTYILTVSTPSGCATKDTVNVVVFRGPDIYVPNSFSPNDNRVNDILNFFPIGIVELKYFRIFNRWGQEVFSSTSSNKGWDGKFKGQPQDTGIFTFITQGIDFRGNLVQRKGTILLIR